MLAIALVLAAASARAEALPRFFVMGDGRLGLENLHTGARVDVRYRRVDGTYDPEAIARIRRAFRSRGDQGEGLASLRLIEVLSHLQDLSGARPLRLLSGYRSPTYNAGLRQRGRKAAQASLHTEGLAADIAFPRPMLRRLWMQLRALDCCGAGYYAGEGFLHVDVGRPRFWEPATSRVDENLSAGNARVFARSEFDRYAVGEPIELTLYAVTVPPIRIARAARVAGAAGDETPVTLEGPAPAAADGCLEVTADATRVRAIVGARPASGRLMVETCTPRPERTPPRIESNRLAVEAVAR